MSDPLDELKTRARVRLNARRRSGDEDLKLRDCLNEAARGAGFAHWEHARRVLAGEATPGEDMGGLWYAPACATLLNAWFADYGEASQALAGSRTGVLLPYKRQFVLAEGDFLRELGLDPADPDWAAGGRDLVRAYGSPAWRALARKRLSATRTA